MVAVVESLGCMAKEQGSCLASTRMLSLKFRIAEKDRLRETPRDLAASSFQEVGLGFRVEGS